MQTIAIVGAGSWGTALAVHLAQSGHHVRLWGRDAALIDALKTDRTNAVYLAGVPLPPLVHPTASSREALDGVTLMVLAVPSHGIRHTLSGLRNDLGPNVTVVSATKGLEQHTLQRMSEIVSAELGPDRPAVVLSGPTFAAEVARGLPAAIVVASSDERAAQLVREEFRGPAIRLYHTNDVVGVEIGGALKNVIAIAAGVVESVGLGHNAIAALITRGLAEISRLALAMGGRRETLAGLSGLGDLVLTCTGQLSRNRQVGIELGRGRALNEILSGMRMVAEGVRTAEAALALAARNGVELPIAAQMHAVLEGRVTPRAALNELMLRPQKAE